MWYKKSYDLSSYFNNVNGIASGISNINESLDSYDRFDTLDKLSANDLDNIVYRSEKIALSCRYFLEKKEKEYEEFSEKLDGLFNKNNPVSISYSNKTLRVFTPHTLKRMYRDDSLKENYTLMNYVKAALREYENENKLDLFRIVNSPLILIIKRKSTEWNRMKICDNDNLENGRIVNEVINALGYSDNALMMNVYSCFEKVSDEKDAGMEFIVFAKSDISEHLNDF